MQNNDNSIKQKTQANTVVEKRISDTDSKQKKPSFKQEVFEWLEIITTAVVTVVILFTMVFRVATIDGESMENTLYSGEKIIITNLFYTPQYGDIVVISRNADNSVEAEDTSDVPIIKRVIAVEGQTVDIDFMSGIVYVDGNALDEPYTKTPTNAMHDIKFPVTVPEGCIFVLGDNRNESLDSRSSSIGEEGMIDVKYVLGRAVLRIYPFERWGRF